MTTGIGTTDDAINNIVCAFRIVFMINISAFVAGLFILQICGI